MEIVTDPFLAKIDSLKIKGELRSSEHCIDINYFNDSNWYAILKTFETDFAISKVLMAETDS